MILNPWDHESRHIFDTSDVAPCLCGGSSHCHCQHYVLMKYVANHGDVSATLDSHYYKGCGERAGTERDHCCDQT